VFAGVVVVSVLILAIDAVLRRMEQATMAWRPAADAKL
jgi:hypothetical protein